jgi:hypothetical protein
VSSSAQTLQRSTEPQGHAILRPFAIIESGSSQFRQHLLGERGQYAGRKVCIS